MTIRDFISKTFIWGLIVAFAAQFAIEFSTENIAASCIILSYSMVTLFYFRWTTAIDTHPLSSFAIFGFCVTSGLGAIITQSSAWTPVISELHQPILTFSALALYQVIALMAHAFYRVMAASKPKKTGPFRHLLQKIGIYSIPSPMVLWVMGGMGVFCFLLSRFSAIANGLSFLAWAPFLIPIYAQQVGSSYGDIKKHIVMLIAHASLIAIIAILFNARGPMLAGIMTVSLLFLLAGMRSEKPLDTKVLMKLAMFGTIGIALSFPASNLVTAMAMVRADRGKITPFEMVGKTIDNFKDPEQLKAFKKAALAKDLRTAYDEKYIENPMLARFVITKYHDNALYFAGKISDKNVQEIWDITADFLWITLPQPWLDKLKIDINKQKMQFTMGDTLAHYAIGTPLSGLRTGSIFGEGWVLFGLMFPIIYFGICLVLFVSVDIFAMRTVAGITILSAIGMLNLWNNFLFGITADSLHHLFIGVVRGVPQSILLYAIVLLLSRKLLQLLKIQSVDYAPQVASAK
jgi:hypothetical protein